MYQISYNPLDSPEPEITLNTTDLFTRQDDLETGTEYNISVRAYTKAGAGEVSFELVSTLPRPSKSLLPPPPLSLSHCACVCVCVCALIVVVFLSKLLSRESK